MTNIASVRVQLQCGDEVRTRLAVAADPLGTEAIVAIDIANGLTLLVSDPDVAGSLAGALTDAAELLLAQARSLREAVPA